MPLVGRYSRIPPCGCGLEVCYGGGQRHCRKCHTWKPLTEYFSHPTSPDGRRSHCKVCHHENARAYRESHPEQLAVARRERLRRDPESVRQQGRAWIAKHPEQYRLMHKVQVKFLAAVARGDLVRPDTCEECGRSGIRIEGAHHDYNRPFDVQWLCVRCHRRWDKRKPKLSGGLPITCPQDHSLKPLTKELYACVDGDAVSSVWTWDGTYLVNAIVVGRPTALAELASKLLECAMHEVFPKAAVRVVPGSKEWFVATAARNVDSVITTGSVAEAVALLEDRVNLAEAEEALRNAGRE